MNQKTSKLFRKYAREVTKSPEDAKIAHKRLKAEYRLWSKENGT